MSAHIFNGLLTDAGLRLLDLRHDVLRSEASRPVQGLVVLAEKE